MTRIQFTEYEAFAAAIQDTSISIRMPSRQEQFWSLSYATAGGIRLQSGIEGSGTIGEGAGVTDGWTLFHQTRPGLANGLTLTPDDLFVVPPNGDYCLACHERHDWISVVIPTRMVPSTLDGLDWSLLARPFMLRPQPSLSRRFRSLVTCFLAANESQPCLMNAQAAVDSFLNEFRICVSQLFRTSRRSTSRHFERWYCQATLAIESAEGQIERSRVMFDIRAGMAFQNAPSEPHFRSVSVSRQ